MNVRHTLICVFFLSLRDGDNGLVNAEILVYTGTEGGNTRVGCTFSFFGRRRIFCKDECEEEDILIETERVNAQSGRYTIEYEEGTYPVFSTLMYVSITNLTKSDSGRYKCGLGRSLFPDSYEEFEIRVEDAPITPKRTRTPRPFSTPFPSASTLMATTQTTSSQAQTTTGALLYVREVLVIAFIGVSAAALIFCRKRISKPKDAVETGEPEYVNVTMANRVSEEIGEDGRSRSPPAEISTV